MANTLKFGNGNWATKEGSALAYNDENNNFKPLPFDFSRASNATVINKDGLIEEVGSGQPRIDYTNDSKGALLLEPSRTNAATYSEAFDNSFWIKDNATVVGGYSAPDGSNNAFKLIEGTSNSQHNVRSSFIATTNGSEIAASLFVKADTRSEVTIQEAAYTGVYLSVDLISETITTSGTSANLTKLVNGWFRIDIISTCNVVTAWKLMPSVNGTSTYQGDGTSGLYIYGFQLEDNSSYATSYIPTQGSAVTRLADSCSQTPPDGVIGQTEGTMYVEADVTFDSRGGRLMLIGQTGNFIEILAKVNGKINCFVRTSSTQADILSANTYSSGDSLKIAFGYKENDFALYINGTQQGVDSSGVIPALINQIIINDYTASGYNEAQKYKDIKIYNTRLSNSELAALTQV
jgi:hypothetical protein